MIKLSVIKKNLKPLYQSFADSFNGFNLSLCRLASSRRWPGLAALMMLLSIKPLKTSVSKASTSAKPKRILILSRSIFNEDILVSLKEPELFQIFTLPRKVIKAFASGFLPSFINDSNYMSSDQMVEKSKLEYRRFMVLVLEKVQHKMSFRAILTGNFGYHAEKELAAAASSLGIPFIAIHKENLKSPGLIRHWEKIYRERRGPFLGRKIFVYNRVEKNIQTAAGVFPEEKILVTGMPRLDRVHRWRIKNAGQNTTQIKQPQILFFSFSSQIGLPSAIRMAGYEHQEESKQWFNLSRQTFSALVEVARDNPGIKVVIKMKKRISSGQEEVLLQELLGSRKLSNLDIVYGGDPFSLIVKSNVVCGFNSTALLEAIAADKHVVIPHFDEALDEDLAPYLVDLEGAADYAESAEHLKHSLVNYAQQNRILCRELSPARQRVLEKWMGNSDGQSGRRVRDALVAELNLDS